MEQNQPMQNEHNIYTPDTVLPRRTYTPAMRRLLIAAAAIGLVMAVWAWPALTRAYDATGALPAYAALWGAYFIGFCALNWQNVKHNRTGWCILAAVAVLFLRAVVYKNDIGFYNYLVIPALLMLHMLICTVGERIPEGTRWQYVGLYILGWFNYPFKCIPNAFGALSSLSGSDKSARRGVLIGILCAVPLLIAVAALLISADSVMGYYAGQLVADASLGKVLFRICLGLFTALLFYSFMYSALFKPADVRTAPYTRFLPALSAQMIVSLLLVIYAVFAYFQFAYLTGIKGLPAELTYSEYAVSGFTQLCVVAGINLAVFFAVLGLSEEAKAAKPLLAALMAATCVVLYSGIARLSMYIDAYGLTVNRVLPMWFMIFLCFCVLACFIKLLLPRLNMLRLCATALIVWYLALNLVNVDAMVAGSIIGRAETGGELSVDDARYMADALSSDADGVIEGSVYEEMVWDLRNGSFD